MPWKILKNVLVSVTLAKTENVQAVLVKTVHVRTVIAKL
jgi:hypothetical protein